jgi:hypothetical protein
VANYVRREAGTMVVVGMRFWGFPFARGQNPVPDAVDPVPDAVGDFVWHFDSGEWPQLVRFCPEMSE